jgi:signal transduction histidine kinase
VRPWRTIALVTAVAAVGALGSLLVAAVLGMRGNELLRLLALLVPALVVTIVAAFAAKVLTRRASIHQRLVTIATVGAVVAIANLAVLSRSMFVSAHDAGLLTVLIVYATGAGMAAALVFSKSADEAIDRIDSTAARLGAGDLDARVGPLNSGEELDQLGRTLDSMAKRLKDARSAERDAERMRRDLITAVSHDLRTPLAALRAMIEAIDDEVVDDPLTLRRYVAEMRRSVGHLASMVDDLFEFAQLDAGAIAAETRHAVLGEVVAGAVAAVAHDAATKRVSILTDLGEAWSCACSPRLVRVVQNLLVNAVRHTPGDGTISIAAARAGSRLRLAVDDTGEGVPPAERDRVFEPFYRGDPARSSPGAGLGLALARRIVESLGGTIEAGDAPAAGARFTVELPAPPGAA